MDRSRTFLNRSFVQITTEIIGAEFQPLRGALKSLSHSGDEVFDTAGVEYRNLFT